MANRSANASLSPPRVLVVDDCGIMRDVLGMTLRRSGFQVLPASGGRSALEMARKSQLDAVLMDVNMPEMDGLALLRALRQLSSHVATPVVVISSHDEPARREEALALGATIWLPKPFTPDSVVRVLRTLTARASAPHDAAAFAQASP